MLILGVRDRFAFTGGGNSRLENDLRLVIRIISFSRFQHGFKMRVEGALLESSGLTLFDG